MNLRPYQQGDETVQLAIYNTAGASLPRFKPASLFEIQRRIQSKSFDPTTRWYAEDQGKVVGYATFQANGRVSYPWCLPGHESAAEPLLQQVLQTMQGQGLPQAFAAYRADWPTINQFFLQRGFTHARDMVNYVLGFENMPTASNRISSNITPAVVEDIPHIFALAPSVFRAASAPRLQEALWNNPDLEAGHALFVMRNRSNGAPLAAGIFITTPTFADPRVVDPAMPCFRLGAFGTEGMTTKRIKGLFSFVTTLDKGLFSMGMDLLSYATSRLGDEDELSCFGAQVASDVPLLHSFYQRTFERQGSFPVLQRDLTRI